MTRREHHKPSYLFLLALLLVAFAAASPTLLFPPAAGAQTPACGGVRLRAARAHFRVGAYEMAKGDFDRDGHVDVVAVDSDNVVLLRGTGAGSFAAPQTFPAVNSPRYLTAGDFNNDGLPDVAVGSELFAQQPFENVALLLGNGAGGFGPARKFTFGGTVQSLASGDFNLDGKLDLAATFILPNDVFSLVRVLGDGAGGFGAVVKIEMPERPHMIAVGDLNLDGKPDLVVGAFWPGAAYLLFGDGAGGFGPPSKLTFGGIVRRPVISDVNGDGKPDLLVPYDDTVRHLGVVAVMLGDGAGNFAPPLEAFPRFTNFVALEDLNGDGRRDMVTGGGSVLFGDGAGRFGAPTFYNAGSPGYGGFGGAGVVADFNEDGEPDFATSAVSLLLGDGGGKFYAAERFFLRETADDSARAAAVGDFNGDGRRDLAVLPETGRRVSVLLGDAPGRFSAPRDVAVPPAQGHAALPLNALAVGDFNGDGRQDLVVTDSPESAELLDSVWLLPGDGAGGFGAPVSVAAGHNPLALAVRDFNRDGHEDLAVAFGGKVFGSIFNRTVGQPGIVVLFGNGVGHFRQLALPTPNETFLTSVLAEDFNRDGKLDLAFPRVPGMSSSGSSIAVYAGDDAGHFDPNPIVTNLPFGPGFTVAGDFNEDGTPDLVTAPEGGSARFLAGDGAGRFGAATELATTPFGAVNGLAAADFNGDGHLDVSTSSGQLFTGDGDGGFSASYDYYVFGFVVTGDFDRDGKPDLAHTGNRPLTVVLNESCAAAPTPTPTPLPSPNPIDGAEFFVRQHYRDFLNREPDAPGLAFWKNQIDECATDACREVRRVNVSAAFFLSIEFQETGYLAYCAHQSAFDKGERLKLSDFLKDTQELGAGVVVGQGDWRGQLRENQRKFFESFVQRPEFLAAYPSSLAAESFVSKLDANTYDPENPAGGGVLTAAARARLAEALRGNPSDVTARAGVVREVAATLGESRRRFNRAFVLMQYFGYLRRNPDDPPEPTLDFSGYNFWLAKLNGFGGDFVAAEMVKAFISSDEYRRRFGQP